MLFRSDIDELNQLHRRLVFAEFARQHARLYDRYRERYRPRTAEIVELGRQVSDAELEGLRVHCLQLRDSLEKQMSQAGIDLWSAPLRWDRPQPGWLLRATPT